MVDKLFEQLCLVLEGGRPHGCNLLHRVWKMGEEVKIIRRQYVVRVKNILHNPLRLL
jgi:hypothetical protein